MAGVCSRCKVSESYKYGQELPANKPTFFKVLFPDFEQYLRIPKKIIECFKGPISRECTLRGPSGNEWKVRIERERDDYLFASGWETFVADHRLKMYDLLTFKCHGNSSFKVSIFDPTTGCEKEGSYFAKHGSSSSRSTCSSSLHIENEGFESMFEDREDSHPTSMDDLEILSERSSSEEEDEGSLDGGDKERGCFRRPIKRRRSSSKGKQSQKHYISNRRTVSTEEKEKALEMAKRLMKIKKPTRVPMFVLTMSKTNVYRGFNLTIPNEWAVEHMLQESHQVVLKVPEVDVEKWTVGCSWTPSQCQIRAKWPNFVLDNTLEEHDVCVFELIHKGKSPVFIVHIFRVVPEIVPLTEMRSVF